MTALTKQKALCVATRCTTAQQFIETFHRFCDEQSFFVATLNMRPVGLETPFSIQLADKTPVLRGLCVVLAAWTTPANPHKRPGIRLGIRRLTPESEAIFYQLQAMRTATPLEVVNEASEALSETPVPVSIPPIPTAPRVSPPAMKKPTPIPMIPTSRAPTPTPRAGSVLTVPPKPTPSAPIPVIVEPPTPVPAPVASPPEPIVDAPTASTAVEEQRTPGSDFVLPANPLQDLSDESLVGFVDCTLYEETGNFFRAMDDGFGDDEAAAAPPKRATEIEDAPPTFRPITSAFLDEPTSEPTAEKFPEPTPLPPVPANPFAPPPSAPVAAPLAAIAHESSMKASLARVETSVMRLLDVVDTSRPIDADAAPRSTPLPAGEAYARQVEKRSQKARSKWLLLGAATIAASLVLVIVLVTRSSEEPATTKPASKPAQTAMTDKPVDKPVDKAVTDAPKVDVDPDEVTAVTERDPSMPVVGEGPCRVEVKSTPAGTMVQLDGQTVGPSPIAIMGPCTKRRVDLVHPRYKNEMRWVTPVAGKPSAVDVMLQRPTHTLLVTSQPSGATVSISGRRAGTTPTRIPLMGFSGIDVKIEKNGFEPVTKRIYSKVPSDKLSVTLKRALFIK